MVAVHIPAVRERGKTAHAKFAKAQLQITDNFGIDPDKIVLG
jgi:hypothetical protein